MPHSVSNSNQFLSYFNQIEDYFEVVLELTSHMPFSEKIDQIAQGHYGVSAFVKQHYHKLKYFSEMRNQIVHGFRLDHEHYLLASDRAVVAIKNLATQLTTPPTISSLLGSAITVLDGKQTIQDGVTAMLHDHCRVLPLYDAGCYVTTYTIDFLVGLLLQGRAGDLLEHHLPQNATSVLFLSPGTSIYTIESLFLKQLNQKPIEVIWISEDGTSETQILGKITAKDLPKLYQMSILSEEI